MSAPPLCPIAEPRVIDGAYGGDQYRRMIEVVRREGPWKLILAQHFASADEVVATMSGGFPEGVRPTFDMFLSPAFRGYFATHGTSLFPEIDDCFLNPEFLAMVRAYWKADYARPDNMLFNIQGPSNSYDPAHIDAAHFRGIDFKNTPIWLMNMMAKSGLFTHWATKKAQVITWFYSGSIGGGFTYWPQGPHAQPKRLPAPMWNRGVVVQNEMMYHRGEANGPADQRHPKGLAFGSVFEADPETEDGWRIVTDGATIQRIPASETRFLVHWGAEIYTDFEELKMVMDHSDDLSHERIFEVFLVDLRKRGREVDVPSDPLHDQAFVKLLTEVYDPGLPRFYPAEAPGPHQQQIAA